MDHAIALTALFTLLSSVWDVIEWLAGLPETVFHGYRSLIRSGADAARSLFEDYGYWVVFLGTLLENTLFVGLIVPGALVIILAGLSAHDGSISAPIAIVLGAAGTIIGDTISYCLGRFGWSRFGNGKAIREFEAKIREPLLRRGALFVLVYHFAGYTRLFGPAAAGFLKMPYRRWAVADYLGACLWVTAYLAIGYGLGMAGLTLDSTDEWFRYFEWGLLIIVAIWAYFLYRAGLGTLLAGQISPDDAEQAAGIESEVSRGQ
ncbi:MAG TPA: DedA family protein [Dehalococcoidia bacterium]|nr:DedA family protein [Dehalococcoidia bacterium]